MSIKPLFTSVWLMAGACVIVCAITAVVYGDDWTRFRGRMSARRARSGCRWTSTAITGSAWETW